MLPNQCITHRIKCGINCCQSQHELYLTKGASSMLDSTFLASVMCPHQQLSCRANIELPHHSVGLHCRSRRMYPSTHMHSMLLLSATSHFVSERHSGNRSVAGSAAALSHTIFVAGGLWSSLLDRPVPIPFLEFELQFNDSNSCGSTHHTSGTLRGLSIGR